MDSLATLTTVLEHARSERDQALAALRQAEAAASAARAQAEQLESYRDDYRQRWNARLQEPAPITLLQHVQAFSGRLDQAISLQSNSVRQSELRVKQSHEVLLAREMRMAAVGKLIERRQAEIRHASDRREQRQFDEAAARTVAAARDHSPLI